MQHKTFLQTCLLLLCILTLSTFCKKGKVEPELVSITTTGENTMGFYVDGTPVNITGKYGGFLDPNGVTGSIFINNSINLFGSGGNPNHSISIFVPLDSISASGEFILNSSKHHTDEVVITSDASVGVNIYTSDSTHTVKITFSHLENGIASGTFYFDAIHPETGKVIHVTEGRFDINLK